jgi:hypothetical protein
VTDKAKTWICSLCGAVLVFSETTHIHPDAPRLDWFHCYRCDVATGVPTDPDWTPRVPPART